jgi:chloramphenicol 3-O-phosphotransferase
MIVAGRAEMTPDPSDEAVEQLALRHRLACCTCDAYAGAGFTVIYQDVILGQHLADVHTQLARWSPGVVVLDPTLDVVAARDAKRRKTVYGGDWTPEKLARALDETPRLGLWLDTSSMTVDATAEFILAHPERTRRGV